MFGYVRPYVPDLLVRDNDFFRSVYCGLCRTMRSETGAGSCALLSYDLAFLALIRLLYVEDLRTETLHRRCVAHPLRKRPIMKQNEALRYAAHASAILSYYKMKDEKNDGKGMRRIAAASALSLFPSRKSRRKYAELDRIVSSYLTELNSLEKEKCPSVDRPAEVFGKLLGAVFSYGLEGANSRVTEALGVGLGKFIYAADAADDYESDKKTGSYNPYVILYESGILTSDRLMSIRTALTLMLEDIERAVNLLPLEGKDCARRIIENIIYAGLPRRIDAIGNGREKEIRKDERSI